jgi:hypothetical protein
MKIYPITFYIKYLIQECYEEDYDPYYAQNWLDNYCYQYTFVEWYFLYRKRFKLTKIEPNFYRYTPIKLIIGADLYSIDL